MKFCIISSVLLCFVIRAVCAAKDGPQPLPRMNVPVPPPEEDVTFASTFVTNVSGSAFFDQLLDHHNPGKGTFKQKYWWNAEFWGGPGSPVVFFTPGEVAAAGYTGYVKNSTITGHFAQAIKGAAVMLEHRYYGDSSPYQNLTVENLQLLTVGQAIADNVYFAQQVDLAFDQAHSSNAPNAPWVFSGGSYSGALAAYTESTAPGTFWAYHSSSAPVEAIFDFWQYFAQIQKGMPKNCSRDVSLVIDYVDDVLRTGSPSEQKKLKSLFGLEAVEHPGDFGSTLEAGPWLWQSNSPYTGYSSFYQFCDAIENVTAGAAVIPDENGVGLETALNGYANWIKPANNGKDACTYYGYDEYDFGCYNTYDPKNYLYTDLRVDNIVQRQWTWILCNEPLSFWQDGAPSYRDTIVSRFANAAYWQRQCELYFPTEKGIYTYGSKNPSVNVDRVNKWTKGWNLDDTTRLTWTNGEYDPWLPGSVSSDFRPGGPLASTKTAPINVIPKGIHCYDLIIRNGLVDPGIQSVIDTETKQIVEWVDEYYSK